MNFAGRKVYVGRDVAEEVISMAELDDSVEALSHRELASAARRRKAGAKMRTHKCRFRARKPSSAQVSAGAGTSPSMAVPLAAEAAALSDSDSDDERGVRERISTNVVAVDLESVREAIPPDEGPWTVVLRCPNPRCGALFSSQSKMDGTTWTCEFCASVVGLPPDVDPSTVAGRPVVPGNDALAGDASPAPDLDSVASEDPVLDGAAASSGAGGDGGTVADPVEAAGATSVAEFVLCDPESEAAAAAAAGDTAEGVATTGIVFVCDISGSMTATSRAPRGFKREDAAEALRLAEEEARSTLTAAGLPAAEIEQQLAAVRAAAASSARSGGVYISRLEGLQQAIRSQVGDLATEAPTRPVALVTFCDNVGVHTAAGQKTLTGATLRSVPRLQEAGEALWATHAKPVASCSDDIASIVKRLEPEGGTALGPGTIVGISIAAKMGAGSRVMVVTDGVANTGVGCLSPSDPDFAELGEEFRGSGFYDKAGRIAADLGVVVDVVAISGDGAALEHLGNLAAAANGEIRTVDPASLAAEFDEIVAAEVFATQAEVATVVNSHLAFEDPEFWGWKAFSDGAPAPAPAPSPAPAPVPAPVLDDDAVSDSESEGVATPEPHVPDSDPPLGDANVGDESDALPAPPVVVRSLADGGPDTGLQPPPDLAIPRADLPELPVIPAPAATTVAQAAAPPIPTIPAPAALAKAKAAAHPAAVTSAAGGDAAALAAPQPPASGAMARPVPPLPIGPSIIGDGTGTHRIVTGVLLSAPRHTGLPGTVPAPLPAPAPGPPDVPDLGGPPPPPPGHDDGAVRPAARGVALGLPKAVAASEAPGMAAPVADAGPGLDGPSRVWRKAGNVMPGSEFTLAFGARPTPLPEGVKQVPFQMQVWFKRPGDKRRFLRVVTQQCPVTAELEEATGATNMVTPVMAAYARQRAAQLAALGQYRQCRAVTQAYGRVLAQNAVMLASDAEVERLLAPPKPAPSRPSRPRREGRGRIRPKSKKREARAVPPAAKASMLGSLAAMVGMAPVAEVAAAEETELAPSLESSDEDSDGAEAGMAARLERIGSGDGEAGCSGGGDLAVYGSWLSGMAGLDNAIREEMQAEAEEGLALEDDEYVSAALSATAGPGTADSDGLAASAALLSLPASGGARSAAFATRAPAMMGASPVWAGSSGSASHMQRAQGAMRSARRSGNDGLSSAIQQSMRRGKTSGDFARRALPPPHAAVAPRLRRAAPGAGRAVPAAAPGTVDSASALPPMPRRPAVDEE